MCTYISITSSKISVRVSSAADNEFAVSARAVESERASVTERHDTISDDVTACLRCVCVGVCECGV